MNSTVCQRPPNSIFNIQRCTAASKCMAGTI